MSAGIDQSNNGESAQLPIAERRPLTIVFCDIVNSTQLADRLAPEDLQSILDVFHDVCTEQFERFGGYIADRPGDGVLVYFGYPAALEDDAERALKCSLSLMRAIADAKTRPGITISIRIGIATGRIVMANMRRHQDRRPVAVGRYVHLANRVQSLAAAGEICLDDNTRRQVANAFDFEDRGWRTLRGFSEKQRIWSLLAADKITTRFEAQRGFRLLPMVGRSQEMAMLHAMFKEVSEGRGQSVAVIGDAGFGKSRLVHEFQESVRDQDPFTFHYQCSPHYTSTALYPLTSHFERGAGITAFDDVATRRRKLRQLLRPTDKERSELFPLLCERLGILKEGQLAELEKIPARQRLDDLTRAMAERTLSLAQSRTVLILCEDAHWLDPTSIAAVGDLMHKIDRSRIMMLITQRAPLAPSWEANEKLARVQLSPLSDDELHTMIQAAADGKTIPKQIVDRIIAQTEGVPLFVEEVTRMVLQSPNLRLEADRFVITGALPELSMPDNLEKTLLARLDRAGEAKGTAQLAAVLGRDFPEELLFSLTELDTPLTQGHIDQLMDVGVLVDMADKTGRRYGFRHALLQEAAYSSLTRDRRKDLHARVALVLEENWSTLIDRRPELLAHHLSCAENHPLAVTYWQRAARQARRVWANEEAISWLTRGLRELESIDQDTQTRRLRLDMHLELGDALRDARGTSAPETKAAYVAARALCTNAGELLPLCRALYGQFVTNFNNADLAAAGPIAEELLQVGGEAQHTETLVCGHQAMGMYSFVTGRFALARHHLEHALFDYQKTDGNSIDTQYPGNTQSYLSWTLYVLGEEFTAVQMSERSLKEAHANGPYRYALTLANACYLHQFRGDVDRVLKMTDELFAIATEHGLRAWADIAEFFRCWAVHQQQPDRHTIGDLVDKLGQWPDQEIETPYFKTLVAEAYVRLGDLEQANENLNNALALVQASGETWYKGEMLRLKWLINGRMTSWSSTETAALRQSALELVDAQQAIAWRQRIDAVIQPSPRSVKRTH